MVLNDQYKKDGEEHFVCGEGALKLCLVTILIIYMMLFHTIIIFVSQLGWFATLYHILYECRPHLINNQVPLHNTTQLAQNVKITLSKRCPTILFAAINAWYCIDPTEIFLIEATTGTFLSTFQRQVRKSVKGGGGETFQTCRKTQRGEHFQTRRKGGKLFGRHQYFSAETRFFWCILTIVDQFNCWSFGVKIDPFFVLLHDAAERN